MLIDRTLYLWKRTALEDLILTESPFSFAPAQPISLYRLESPGYEGEVTILETPDAIEPLYQGILPYEPEQPIAFDGLVFIAPVDTTLHFICETGTLKAVLEPYLNTATGMSYIRNGYVDDQIFNTDGLASFLFNGVSAGTVYVSSNHFLGFGANAEQLKVCRRDGCCTAVYRQSIQTPSGLEVLKIRFEGYTVYSNRVESNRLIFEVFLLSNQDFFLNVIQTPTSGNTGESSLVCNGQTIPLALNTGTWVSFYHLDDLGKTWDIRYEMYQQADLQSHLFLIRLEDGVYTVTEDALQQIPETELTALTFLQYGYEGIPPAQILTPLNNPDILMWHSGSEDTPIRAVIKAYPYPQTLLAIADMSHETILGIKLMTAEFSGSVTVSFSVDDGLTFSEEVPIMDWLNYDLVALWEMLPESKHLHMRFILHEDATLSRFKITYEN